MRKLVLVSSILLCTWLALGLPSWAAEKPGAHKGAGSTYFVGENKSMGSCYMSCDGGGSWEYIGEGSLEACTCYCALACGYGYCDGYDTGTGQSGTCYVT